MNKQFKTFKKKLDTIQYQVLSLCCGLIKDHSTTNFTSGNGYENAFGNKKITACISILGKVKGT